MLPSTIVGWNFPFDSQWLPDWVFDVDWIDGMVLHGVLHPDAPSRSLKQVGPSYSGIPYKKTLADGPMSDTDLEEYLALDLYQTGIAVNSMLVELEKHPSKKLFSWLMGLERDLSWMSKQGAKVDVVKARQLAEECFKIQQTEVNTMSAIGKQYELDLKFKPNKRFSFSRSSKQILELVYTRMGLPKHLTEKGNLSLSDEVCLSLRSKDPTGFIASFGRFLDAQENVSRYVEPFVSNSKDWIDSNSFVHPVPNLVRYESGADSSEAGSGGTVTGRITWKDPATQVFPEFGRPIFVPRIAGGSFWVIDLSQAEPRSVAFMSGEDVLIEAFIKREDPYRAMMAKMLHCDPASISQEVRDAGKTIYLACLYGAGAAKIQSIFLIEAHQRVPISDCQQMIKRRAAELPNLTAWSRGIIEKVNNGEPIVTPTGRCRLFPQTDDPEVIRQAINFQPQSFASDLNHAICREVVADARRAGDFWPLFTIHDSIEIDTAPSVDFKPYVTDVYESIPYIVKKHFGLELNVPMAYTMSSGDCWR